MYPDLAIIFSTVSPPYLTKSVIDMTTAKAAIKEYLITLIFHARAIPTNKKNINPNARMF